MAVTMSAYYHLPKLILNKEINLNNIKVALLNNSAAFTGTHTAKSQVDNGASATVTVTIATPGVFTDTAHGFSAGQALMFSTTGALPTGISPGTVYYVIASGLTTDNYQVSTSVGGSAVNTTGSQSGTHTRYSVGSYEVNGNAWHVGGESLANFAVSIAAISDATVNDAMLDFDDIDVVASGGTIGPAYKAIIYDSITMRALIFVDFGQAQSAGDTTSFKFRLNALGLINLTQ